MQTSQNLLINDRQRGHCVPAHDPSNRVVGNFVRQERYSTVTALSIQEILANHTVPESFDTASFIFAIKYFILPFVGRFAMNEPRSVIVLDNARIHDADEFIEMCRQSTSVLFAYLMPAIIFECPAAFPISQTFRCEI